MQTKRVALYLRVSTDEQTIENQRQALRSEAERRGWHVAHEYSDEGISGAKERSKRPGLDRMLRDATRGRFDVCMCWAVDRLGRSLADLISTMQELNAAHVDLFLHQQAIDTTTPFGRAMFQMLGVFAEFEHALIQARTQAGLARARAAGKVLGRPVERDSDAKVEASLAAGHSIRQTRRLCGVGYPLVMRVRRQMIQDGRLVETAPESSAAPSAPDSAPIADAPVSTAPV